MNALYYNIHTEEIEDHTGKGIQDLEGSILRTPDDPQVTFTEANFPERCDLCQKMLGLTTPSTFLLQDPLRVLRAVRFAAQLEPSFRLDPALIEAASLVDIRSKVSAERIGREIALIAQSRDPSTGFSLLQVPRDKERPNPTPRPHRRPTHVSVP